MDLTKPDGIGELNISRMTIIANGFELDFEGQVEGYGAVFCSHLLTYISGDENRGTLTGEARTFLNDGKVICKNKVRLCINFRCPRSCFRAIQSTQALPTVNTKTRSNKRKCEPLRFSFLSY